MKTKMNINKMTMSLKLESLPHSLKRERKNLSKNQSQNKAKKKTFQMNKILDYLLKLQNKCDNQL